MKKLIFIFIPLISVITYGQSKKALNTAYCAELNQLKTSYDSTVTAYLTAEKQLEQSRKNVRTQLKDLDGYKYSFITKTLEIDELKNKLTALGVDAKTLVAEEPSNQIIPSFEDVKREQKLYTEVFTFKVMYDTLQLDKMKIKDQNPLLVQLIENYKASAVKNLEVIKKEQVYIWKLDSIRNSLNTIKAQYELIEKSYSSQRNVLKNKLQELEDNYRAKGPKGFPEAYSRVFPKVFSQQPEPSKTKNEKPHIVEDNYELKNRETVKTADPPPATAENQLISLVDVPAEFPGGPAALKKYLTDNLVYPKRAEEEGIEGKCYLRFVITEDGSISDVKVQRGVPDCKECDDEAVRLVTAMPKWIPGKMNDKPVKQSYNLPVPFKLL